MAKEVTLDTEHAVHLGVNVVSFLFPLTCLFALPASPCILYFGPHLTNNNIENNTWAHRDMEFVFECSNLCQTSNRSERVRY